MLHAFVTLLTTGRGPFLGATFESCDCILSVTAPLESSILMLLIIQDLGLYIFWKKGPDCNQRFATEHMAWLTQTGSLW